MNPFRKRQTDTGQLHPLDHEIGRIVTEAIGRLEDPEVLAHLREAFDQGRGFIGLEILNDGSDDAIVSLAGIALCRLPAIIFSPSRFNSDAN